MSDSSLLAAPALGLVLLLGLRHGLDPDHVAVIDNLTFRAADERPELAPWVGTLFAIGHSLSVAAVALGVALFLPKFVWPGWVTDGVDIAVIALLILVGSLNLAALRRSGSYRPVGWRQGFVPKALRESSTPLAIVAVGAVFGLVFDTATQAAAWGLAASSAAGVVGAALVAGVFAAGMIVTDTVDSRIVAALLRSGDDAARVRTYRRAVGWLIVALSYGMAAYALAGRVTAEEMALSDDVFTALGAGVAMSVIAMLLWSRRRAVPGDA